MPWSPISWPGSVEWLTPDNDDDHWDMIEGQGSLFHVSYSGVTMALIHGGAPDALILSHEPTRPHMRGLPGYAMPSLEALRDTALPIARIANPKAQVVGISVNTAAWGEDEAMSYLEGVEKRMGLPAVDPFRQGAGRWRRAGRVMISVTRDTFRLAQAFTISRGSRTEAQVLTVRVMRRGVTGMGRMRALCALRRDAGQRRGPDRGASRRHLAAGPAGRAAAGGRAQRRRLRAVGLEGETGRHAVWHRLAGLPAPQAGGDRLYPVARHARQHARGGGEARPSPASEDQARHARRHAAARGRARGRAGGR
jgi:hypothetical protein